MMFQVALCVERVNVMFVERLAVNALSAADVKTSHLVSYLQAFVVGVPILVHWTLTMMIMNQVVGVDARLC